MPTDPHAMLRHYRPSRYDHTDRVWMEPAIVAREGELLAKPDEQAVVRLARIVAEREVRAMEEGDVRLVHRFLKEVGRTGAWPFDTPDFGPEGLWVSPLKIGHTTRALKVRFEVVTGADLVAWELERSRQGHEINQRIIWETTGARLLAGWMQAQGAPMVGKIDKGAIPALDAPAPLAPLDLDEDEDDP